MVRKDAKLSGEELRVLLEHRFPGIIIDIADSTIETKLQLVGENPVDIIHYPKFNQQYFIDVFSAIVPSSLSHKRWICHLNTPEERLNAFRQSYYGQTRS